MWESLPGCNRNFGKSAFSEHPFICCVCWLFKAYDRMPQNRLMHILKGLGCGLAMSDRFTNILIFFHGICKSLNSHVEGQIWSWWISMLVACSYVNGQSSHACQAPRGVRYKTQILHESEVIMFTPCVFVCLSVCVYVCHDVCPDDLTMKDWCHTIFCSYIVGDV